MSDIRVMTEVIDDVCDEFRYALAAVTGADMESRYSEPITRRALCSETNAHNNSAALIVAMSTIDWTLQRLPMRNTRQLADDIDGIMEIMKTIIQAVSTMHVDYVRAKRALDKAA